MLVCSNIEEEKIETWESHHDDYNLPEKEEEGINEGSVHSLRDLRYDKGRYTQEKWRSLPPQFSWWLLFWSVNVLLCTVPSLFSPASAVCSMQKVASSFSLSSFPFQSSYLGVKTRESSFSVSGVMYWMKGALLTFISHSHSLFPSIPSSILPFRRLPIDLDDDADDSWRRRERSHVTPRFAPFSYFMPSLFFLCS